MTYLTSNQLKQYQEEGYLAPIDVLSKDEAFTAREEIELIEKEIPNEIDKSGRYNVHLISPKLDSIVHNSKILDVVESIIGKDILVCSTTLFIKNPNEEGFVSYHQDAKYIGLEPHNWVTAWVGHSKSSAKTAKTFKQQKDALFTQIRKLPMTFLSESHVPVLWDQKPSAPPMV